PYYSSTLNYTSFTWAKYWVRPTHATPDFFNTCARGTNVGVPKNWEGNQVPHTGNAYAGFFVSLWPGYGPYFEYVECKLNQTLRPNHHYYTSFYANMAQLSPVSL